MPHVKIKDPSAARLSARGGNLPTGPGLLRLAFLAYPHYDMDMRKKQGGILYTDLLEEYMSITRTPEERFFALVDKNGPKGCWLWKGFVNERGYGQFTPYHKKEVRAKQLRAHRYSYSLTRSIPKGFVIDHLCRVRNCVNPKHLEAVTSKENNRRSESNAGKNYRKTACKRGHPFDKKNTRYLSSGAGRQCRICSCLRAMVFYWRKKGGLQNRQKKKFSASLGHKSLESVFGIKEGSLSINIANGIPNKNTSI